MAIHVPFNNLRHRLERHRAGLDAAYAAVIDSAYVVLGTNVTRFQDEFAAFVGTEACIGVANGTDALELALRGIGIDADSVVATAANAGGYTSTAIRSIGAAAHYTDVDAMTHTMDLDAATKAIAQGVDAIVLTHLYGQLAPDTAAIAHACTENDVALIEDCAQAHGAQTNGQVAGSFGVASAFSFYPTKNLGAIGDGGAVCSDSDTASRISQLRQYGWSSKYTTDVTAGRNSRLDELQAAFLLAMLPSLAEENAERVAIAQRYVAGIDSRHIELPQVASPEYVAHLFVIQSNHRDDLEQHFKQHDVSTAVHYPIPDHHQSVVTNHQDWSLPATELLAERILSLPCYPGMEEREVSYVIECANAYVPNAQAEAEAA